MVGGLCGLKFGRTKRNLPLTLKIDISQLFITNDNFPIEIPNKHKSVVHYLIYGSTNFKIGF